MRHEPKVLKRRIHPLKLLIKESDKVRTNSFQNVVIQWFSEHGRTFPWRTTTNSFHVLVAEVLLRRTQAERVVAPYIELIQLYPNPQSLAAANVDMLREWFRPYGLVRRADNLVETAKLIENKWGGHIPNDLNAILKLPGIGIYSARAILCLGYGFRVPMIDEGSGRLLRRLIRMTPNGPAYCDRTLLQTAEQILPDRHVREFNLGLIDIGAAVCRPRVPFCPECPLLQLCHYNREVVPTSEGC